MRAIETATGNSIATHHVIGSHAINQFRAGNGHIGSTLLRVPVHMLLESLFQFEVTNIISSGVVVEQAIETDALHRCDERSHRREWLKTTTGTDAYTGECTVFIFFFAGVEIDIGKSIQLVHHDIDVIASDTRRLNGNTLTFIDTSNGAEFTAGHLTFYRIEMRGNGGYTSRITNKDYLVCQILGLEMEVECASVLINGEFRSRKMSFTHSDKILMFYDVRRKLVTAFYHVGLLVIDSNYLVIANAAAH